MANKLGNTGMMAKSSLPRSKGLGFGKGSLPKMTDPNASPGTGLRSAPKGGDYQPMRGKASTKGSTKGSMDITGKPLGKPSGGRDGAFE